MNNTKLKSIMVMLLLSLVTFSNLGCTASKLTEQSKPTAAYESLVIGGSGTNLPITRKLAQAYMEQNPGTKISIPESLGSAGGVKNTSDGILDIGLVSRELTPDEKKLGLSYIPYAKVLIVFATNTSITVDSITNAEVNAIYGGKLKNWRQVGGPDEKIIVLSREYNDSGKLRLNDCLPGFKDVAISRDAILLRTDQAMNEAIPSIQNSIGWTDMGAIVSTKMNVNILKLDGVAPTAEMNQVGKYPHDKTLAFLIKGEPSQAAQGFINFARGPQGKRILLENGYIQFNSEQ